MSSDIEGLVESSLNLGIFKMGDDEACFSYSVRSSKCTYKDFMSDKLETLITMLGGLAGEEIMCGDVTSGSSDDVGKARRFISQLMNVGAFGFDKLLPVNMIGRLAQESFPTSSKRIEIIEKFECDLLTEAFDKAKTLISENKTLVEAIYKELKQKERLSKREVEKIINSLNDASIADVSGKNNEKITPVHCSVKPGFWFSMVMITIPIFRFFVEFCKMEQISYAANLPLNMGQLLSIPLFLCGLFLLIITQFFKGKNLH